MKILIFKNMNRLNNIFKKSSSLFFQNNSCLMRFFNKPPKNFALFYTFNKFTYARNVKSSKKVSLDSEANLNYENITSYPQNENSSNSSNNYQSEDMIPLETENLSLIIDKLHFRGKIFQIESNRENFQNLEEFVEYYKYLTNNINKLNYFQQEKFIRAICYFKIKDEKTKDILTKYLNTQPNNTHSALFVIYVLTKMEIQIEDLVSQSFKIITENGIVNSDKLYVIPFMWAISEMQVSKKEVNCKIDDFIREQINFMNEYETSILLRFYSKLYYYNYEMLEIVLKRCLYLCSYFSLRYILIISKCLAEMKIRNLNLLTGLQERLFQIIKLNIENPDDENYLTADYLSQILSNFVKIEFLDFQNFSQIENLFFELAEKQGIKNKETIYSILSSHCVFIRKVYQEINFKKEKSENEKVKNSPIKIKKEYKKINENFYERFLPHLINFQDEMNFLTISNIVVLIKNSNLTKRKCLRLLQEFYLNSIDKFLNPTSIKEIDKPKKVEEFIKIGLKMCQMDGIKKSVITKLEENGIDTKKYIEYLNKEKIETEDKKIKDDIE